jgi:purine-binding chemotaxis protein CheW
MAESMPLATRPPQLLAIREEEKTPNRFLTFSLGGETLAMEIRYIREILQYGGVTEVPLTPPALRGVMNLRGAVVPVIDLAVRFGRVPASVDRRTCIVILEVEEEDATTVMGIVVDSVREVLEIPDAEIEPPPPFGNAIRADFIQGVGKIGGRFVILLNVERVLSTEELGTAEARS